MSFLNFVLLSTEIFFINCVLLFIWVGLYLRYKTKSAVYTTSFNGYAIFLLLLTLLLYFNSSSFMNYSIFNHLFSITPFSLMLKELTIICSIFVICAASRYDLINTKSGFDLEVVFIRLIISFSMLLLCGINDLVYLFFILELYSLSACILIGYRGGYTVFSAEAALKYFLIGTMFSILMAYGIAVLYWITGLTAVSSIELYLMMGPQTDLYGFQDIMLNCGIFLVLIGFLFKIGAAPVHFWAPDVYEGAPTSTMFFLFVIPKIALFGSLIVLANLWDYVFFGLTAAAVISILVGTILGLFQKRIKRLFVYSTINNNGLLLLALLVLNKYGFTFLLFFLFTYLFSLFGLFGLLLSLRLTALNTLVLKNIWAWTSLLTTSKARTLVITLLLFSSAGLPPLVGFISKFLLLFGLVINSSSMYALVCLTLLLSSLSCFYYIRLVKIMAFNKKKVWLFLTLPGAATAYIISFSIIFLIIFFLISGTLLNFFFLVL